MTPDLPLMKKKKANVTTNVAKTKNNSRSSSDEKTKANDATKVAQTKNDSRSSSDEKKEG